MVIYVLFHNTNTQNMFIPSLAKQIAHKSSSSGLSVILGVDAVGLGGGEKYTGAALAERTLAVILTKRILTAALTEHTLTTLTVILTKHVVAVALTKHPLATA